MQNAQTYLEVVRDRGERRLELCRVYRHLKDRELFVLAYAKLYANAGALTPGTNPSDTVDAMSLRRIDDIIKTLDAGTYRWKPVRRTHIPKKNGKTRPLGMPSWNDKLLQEGLRMVLSAYYEPQFSDLSHGFRPGRGCHTALSSIRLTWRGTKWFIEGDIKGCFDNINHDKLLDIIGRKIKDQRLMKLLRGLLEAGYLENWAVYPTYSGVPQGGVLSPLLTNILLNELDQYIANTLIPKHTQGQKRRWNKEYARVQAAKKVARQRGNIEEWRRLNRQQRGMNSTMFDDPNYRRLRYTRYADDFLLGYVGTRAEAKEIKNNIALFLQELGLTLSLEKTTITHATQESARFLGYDVSMCHCDSRMSKVTRQRTINGQPIFRLPKEVAHEWRMRHTQRGKAIHRTNLLERSDYDIVMTYGLEFQGLVNYYTLASNVAQRLYPVKYAFLKSLTKTLAYKHKQSVTWVFKRYRRTSPEGVTCIMVEVPRPDRKPLVAKFGDKPIHFNATAKLSERQTLLLPARNELVKRLTANQCELCGSKDDIEVHHVRKLKDLQNRYRGRSHPPLWVTRLIELRRKTLVVCRKCHRQIHSGTYDGISLKQD